MTPGNTGDTGDDESTRDRTPTVTPDDTDTPDTSSTTPADTTDAAGNATNLDHGLGIGSITGAIIASAIVLLAVGTPITLLLKLYMKRRSKSQV